MTGCQNSWYLFVEHERADRLQHLERTLATQVGVRDMLIGRSIKSVRRVWIRHSPRREDTEIIGDTEAGVPFSTVWDEVRQLSKLG